MMSILLAFVTAMMVNTIKAGEAETVPGAVIRELPKPIFYTTYIPIIYELKTPTWSELNLRLNWASGHTVSCLTDAGNSWSNAGCPSVYYYNPILDNFYKNTMSPDIKNLKANESLNTIESMKDISCDEISQHFGKLRVDLNTWKQYWKSLTECPIGESVQYQSSTYSSLDLSKFDTMLRAYYTRYSGLLSSYQALATYANAYSAYQTSALIHHLVESDRWNDAFVQCGSKRLPRSLVTEAMIKSSLSEAANKLTAKHFNLSMGQDDFISYYELPLTECILSTSNNSYVIRTLAPVIPSHSKYKLVTLESTPFTLRYNSSAETNLLCGISGIQGKYIYDEETGFVSTTDCEPHELCLISNLEGFATTDPCIFAIFENNTELMKRNCQTKCLEVNTKRFPFFRRIASDKYVVVGRSQAHSDIFINCRGKPYKVIAPNDTGAFEVTLPCYCKIIYQSEELHSYEPCGSDKIIIRQITPLVWDETFNSRTPSDNANRITTTASPSHSSTSEAIIAEEIVPEVTMKLIQDIVNAKCNTMVNSTLNEDIQDKVDELENKIKHLWIVVAIFMVITIALIAVSFLVPRLSQRNQNQKRENSHEQFVLRSHSNVYDEPMILMDK